MPHHVFLHVPKTAGSSLRTVLSRHYGARHVLYADLGAGDRRPLAEIGAAIRAQLDQREIRLITGHQFFGLHAALLEPCLYFSMLRDPVERALSEYFYAFNYPLHAQRAEILSGALTPQAFMAGRGSSQARQLAGRSTRPVLEAALAHLAHGLAVVGVAEAFDRSLLLMARRLGWAPPLYVARNVTRLAPEQAAARVAARAAAEPAGFATDIALHEAARARFDADCAAEGPDFERASAAFARCQAALAAEAGALVHERYEFNTEDALPVRAAAIRAGADYAEVAAFLASPARAPARPRNLVGRIEAVADGELRGWAADLFDPAPATLRLMAGEVALGATRAQLRRPGLALRDGCCGFRLALPGAAAGRRDLRLVLDGTGLALDDPGKALGG